MYGLHRVITFNGCWLKLNHHKIAKWTLLKTVSNVSFDVFYKAKSSLALCAGWGKAQEEVNNCQDVSLMWFPPTIYLWSCKILHFFWFTIQVILQQCPLQLHRVYSNSCSQQRSLIVSHNTGDFLVTKFVLLVFWWPQSMIHNGGSLDHPSISVGEPFLQVVFKTRQKIWFRTCELYYAACGFLTEADQNNEC